LKQVDYDETDNLLLIKFTGSDFNKNLTFVKALISSLFVMAGRFWTAPAIESNVKKLQEDGWEFTTKATTFLKKNKQSVVKIDESKLEGLFPFQVEGVKWLEQNNGIGIISDEMGCGKSAQAVSYAKLHKEQIPILVVCPASVKLQWKNEIKFWAKSSSIEVLYGRTRYDLPSVKWYVINYDILGEEVPKLDEHGNPIINRYGKEEKYFLPSSWVYEFVDRKVGLIILDECQFISHDSIRTRAVRLLKQSLPKAKLIGLSGTPIRNRPAEFFNILNLLAPKVFGSKWKFYQKFCDPMHNGYGWTYTGASNLEELHELVKPYMIRRLKSEVLKQLPSKIVTIVPLELEEIERRNYNDAEEKFKEWLESHFKDFITIQEQMEKLKQLAYLAKRNSVLQWIEDFLTTGKKLVVMTYHKMAMDDIYGKFNKVAVKIDGSTSHKGRQEAKDKFIKDDSIKLFVGQILAAGVGVDGLQTVCDTMAMVEFTYTPADHAQAEDRLHRMSKDGKYADSVSIYYLVADGTIENSLVEMLVAKHKVTKKILDGKEEQFFDGQEKNLVKRLSDKYRRVVM
jgi:SWI/SNF-related matrix-associated actin-dependent regulator 1 of chromatin subfamily A